MRRSGNGRLPEESLLELLVEGLEDLHSTGYEDPTLFYTLTNTASALVSDDTTNHYDAKAKLEETVKRVHRQFRYDTLPWSYYTRAESLLQKPSLFSDDQRASPHVLGQAQSGRVGKERHTLNQSRSTSG